MSTFLQQSSSAHDRSLGEWYELIRTGRITLPRFQRFEAWDRGRVQGFLNTIIQNLPVGVTLLLEVGDEEKFKSRHIETAPRLGSRPAEHLLDGQQRLTAFWRAMHNNYESELYFVWLPSSSDIQNEHEPGEVHVQAHSRWSYKGKLRPIWADSPKGCWERRLVPMQLLRPGDMSKPMDEWIDAATQHMKPEKDDPDAYENLGKLYQTREEMKELISVLRERVAHYNLPYLALPPATDADVALRVFVNMNTNSKPLSMYDLTVAKVEQDAGASLHELQEHLEDQSPEVTRYGDLDSPLLHIGALLQGQPPNKAGINQMDRKALVKDWPRIESAMVRTADFLARQHVYDAARLPTNVVLPVIAACFDALPTEGDVLGRGERLLRAYFWTACFTNRYEAAAASRAFQDFKELLALLQTENFGPGDYDRVPILDRNEYALPSWEQLTQAGWPKGADRMARAILAATLYFGGCDFADGHPASYKSLKTREYHHVFPDALLQDAKIDSFLALNCALITWKTNRNIGRKDPLAYLKDRVEWTDEEEVRARLKTHLLDYDILARARYEGASGEPLEGEALKDELKPDFAAFLEARGRCVAEVAKCLAQGISNPSLAEILMAGTPASSEEETAEVS